MLYSEAGGVLAVENLSTTVEEDLTKIFQAMIDAASLAGGAMMLPDRRARERRRRNGVALRCSCSVRVEQCA